MGAEGEVSVLTLIFKLFSIVASVLIGTVMFYQSYSNAIARRQILRDTAGISVLSQLFALILNMLFLSAVVMAVVILLLSLFGLDINIIIESRYFYMGMGAIVLTVVLLIWLGWSLPRFADFSI